MSSKSEPEMQMPEALINAMLDCLAQLDRIGASSAAAHVDAAIHALMADLGMDETSKSV